MTSIDALPFYLTLIVPVAVAVVALLALTVGSLRRTSSPEVPATVAAMTRRVPEPRRARKAGRSRARR
jgi:hypothetical protein